MQPNLKYLPEKKWGGSEKTILHCEIQEDGAASYHISDKYLKTCNSFKSVVSLDKIQYQKKQELSKAKFPQSTAWQAQCCEQGS